MENFSLLLAKFCRNHRVLAFQSQTRNPYIFEKVPNLGNLGFLSDWMSACDNCKNYICAHSWDINLNTWRESPYLHILCIYFSNPQIVIALLFGCSVACKNVTLVSQGRIECRGEGPERLRSDAYIQIQCHGNEQSCYATCDGATTNSNTSKFVGVKTQSKPAWQLFLFLSKTILCTELRDHETWRPKSLLVSK